MNETSKNDLSKLASQRHRKLGDNPKKEFHSHSDEDWGSHELRLQFGDRFKQFKKLFSWLRN